MAQKLGEAYVEITSKDSLDAGLNAARSKVTGWLGNIGQGIAQGVGQALARGIGDLVRAGLDQIGESIQAASNLNESINKVGVAFGESSQQILAWSKNSETALLLSQQQALEAASSFGLLFREMGVGTDKAADMSEQMVQLASDLASINNIPVTEALSKLQSGLVGEVRPLRDVGVLLNDAAVSQEAVKLGLAGSTKAVSDQAKVLARYNLILEQTALQQGDVARTLEGTANQQRLFTTSIKDIQTSIGQVFEPVYNIFLRNINKLIQDNRAWGQQVLENFARGLADGIRYITPAIAQIGAMIRYWLQPHSPPKILPDLDKWGAEAMQIYLKGWTSGNFNELKTLGDAIEGVLRGFAGAGKVDQVDLVSRIFGSTQAVAKAVDEFARLGTVSSGSIDAIRRAAGPAGDSIAGLVGSYFDLQKATKRTADAQKELTDITDRYSKLIDPLDEQIDAVSRKQQDLQDAQRTDQLNQELSDPLLDWGTRQQDQLELQRLGLERQKRALEDQRDTAVNTTQDKLDAAKKEQDAAQETFDKQQAALDQQTKLNQLAGEQIDTENQLAEKRKQAADEAARLAEQLHQAMLSYQLSLTDTAGKIAILRGELAKTQEGTPEYFALLEQIAGLEQQSADESKRKADTLHDAQLSYNLALTDTAGQIAIWRDELAKTQPGTAEYFDILTKIVDLQNSIKGSGDGGGIVPLTPGDVTNLQQTTESVQSLTDAVQGLFDALTGKSNGSVSISDTLRGQLNAMSAEMTFWKSVFSGDWNQAWDDLVTYGKLDQDTSAGNILIWLGTILGYLQTWRTQISPEWAGAISDWSTGLDAWFNTEAGKFSTWFTDRLTDIGTWLGNISTAISTFSLSDAASTMLGTMWDGMKEKWGEISDWWTEKMKWLLSQIPALPSWLGGGGSVTGSSYSGSGSSGSVHPSAVSASLSPAATAIASMTGGSSSVRTDNSVNFHPGSIVVQASSYEAGSDAADGILAKLRSKGIRLGG
jgi:hypothetical protein